MSDVWQGPGWWLASDGKWYPADAEPGAVYDGNLPSDDDSSTSAPAAAAEEPAVGADTLVDTEHSLVEPEMPLGSPDVDVDADLVTTPGLPDVPEVAAPEMPESPDLGTATIAEPESMPEPIVESSTGGWQAIDDVPEAEPEPDLEAEAFASLARTGPTTEEDGWTSAFEQRQADGEVLDDLPRNAETLEAPEMPPPGTISLSDLGEVPPAPAITPIPDVTVPDVAVPDVAVPDVAVPDVAVPDMAVPDVVVPDVVIPDVPMPEVAVPDVSTPDIAVPDVVVPDVPMPEVAVPDISAPDIAVPDVSAPDIGVPDVSMPDVAVPDVSAPDIAVPDVSVPNPNLSATVPQVTSPEATVEEVMPLGGEAPDRAQPAVPIERQDAWRKPIQPDIESARADLTTPRGAPDVVDLAIPQDAPPQEIEAPKRNWRMWLGVLLALALIGLIAWFIAMLFSGNSTTDTDSASTTSEAVAVDDSTTAPSSDVAEDGATAVPDTTEDAESPSSTQSQQASVFDLRAGDCIVGDIGAGQVTKVEKVDCEIEHQFEVYREALIESSITTFDETAISAYAEEVCRTSLAAYIPADDDRNLKFKFLQPTEDSWNQPEDPDRVITCLLFDGDDDPLIGRAN